MGAEAGAAASAAIDKANEPVLLRDDGNGITTLMLNRPGARNALSGELMTALQRELDAIAEDASVRVVVITAHGSVFSAGHDLKELRADPREEAYRRQFDQSSRLMQRIVRLPQPVIAKVQGMATAAGCQLVATCDLAIAAETAEFATPGVDIGLFCLTPMVALSRNISRKKAMEMLLTGEAISASEAVRTGLINRAVPASLLDQAVQELAQKIASKSVTAIALGKEAFYRQLESGLSEAYDYASEVMTRNMLARDAEEGIDAFLEKRAPTWEGR